MRPNVSVIIPCYNYGRYLKFAADSVINQNVELIIVNDGSTDETSDVINKIIWEWSLQGMTVKHLSFDKNRGMPVTRNEGLRLSTCEFMVFLDADDMRIEGSIKKQLDYFDDNPDTMVVWGWALELREDVGFKEAQAMAGKLRWHPAEVNPQTVMYRRKVFEKYGGFYEGLRSGTDKEMAMRLGLHPDSPFKELIRSKKLKMPLAFYRKHEGQIHKLRKADPVWAKETKDIQKDRIKQLIREGVTLKNTRFPI